MVKKYDAAIIGGGPIGAFVAEKLSSEGYDVSIFEKNDMIGEPINCAGLVSTRIFDLCNINKELIILNKIKGANIHSPSDNCLKIGGDRIHALVINRKKFDQVLIDKALDNGVELFLKNKFISANKKDEIIKLIFSKNNEYKCNLLIGADGPNSRVRKSFLFQEPKEFLFGIGAEIKNTNLDPTFVEIFIGNKIAPGFFAWIIPTNDSGTNARIGLCVKEDSKYPVNYYFKNFLKNKVTSNYLKNIKIISYIGGIIPLGPLDKFYKSNVLLVGDAAAQVKPTSGGGIYTGLMCANYCSNISLESLKNNNFSKSFLKKYQRLYKKNIGGELDKGMKFRKIFKNLKDEQFDYYINKFQDKSIIKIISKYGDIDYPSKLAPKLIKKSPSLLRIVTNLIK
jgi:geranylgeranyl reductase family protein